MTTLPPWLVEPLASGIRLRGHALLVHAVGDVGQFAYAQALAAAWLCEAPLADGVACGHCASCHLLGSGTHADYRLLVPDALRASLGLDGGEDESAADEKASKAKPSKEIRIDAVRGAIDWAHGTSARGRAKVMVLHPAESLNLVAANALLKTLEEPPGLLRIVLTAQDPEALLPTVRSRCQRVSLPIPERDAAHAWLAQQNVDDPATLLAAANGLPGDALALWMDGITAQQWSSLPQAIRGGASQSGMYAGWPLPRLVDALQKLCLDLMALGQGGAPMYFSPTGLRATSGTSQPAMPELLAWSRELLAARRHAEHPWHAGLKTEALMARAQAVWHASHNPAQRR